MALPANKSTALCIVRRLRGAGFEALLAGGCVRDMLLHRRVADYDVATNATPQQVRKLFRHVLLIGEQFGIAMVIEGGRKVEVAAFRSDLTYRDGRRPEGVTFTTARQDALRRDFTINGMFYDPVSREVIDYVGGRQDLEKGLVRTIGDPRERFSEDYLRMIRAVRFTVRLGFHLDESAAAAVTENAARISRISGERVFDELSKMLARPSAAQALEMLHRLGLAAHILPELTAAPEAWSRAVERVALAAVRAKPLLTLGALLCDLPPEAIVQILRRWGASNDLREALCWFSAHRDRWLDAHEMPLAALKRLMANENFPLLSDLWRIRRHMQGGQSAQARRIARRLAGIDPATVCPAPLLTGEDLKALGLTEGPRLGRILRHLYDSQLNETLSTREEAIRQAEVLISAADPAAPDRRR